MTLLRGQRVARIVQTSSIVIQDRGSQHIRLCESRAPGEQCADSVEPRHIVKPIVLGYSIFCCQSVTDAEENLVVETGSNRTLRI